MIDQTHDLPVVGQCRILELSRSTADYQALPVPAADLALMRQIDELHLAWPFARARMLSRRLKREGQPVGRRNVSTLMTRWGSMPCIASPAPASGIQPTRSIPICSAIWRSRARIRSGGRGHHPYPDEARLCVSGRRPGLGESAGTGVAAVQYVDHRLLH